MSVTWSFAPLLGTLLVLASFALALSASPWLGGALALAVAVVGAVAYFLKLLRAAFFATLLFGLVGYVAMGRGFAYWGVPPLYVGEMLLLFGLLTLALRGDLKGLVRLPLAWLVLVFMGIGVAATAPHVAEFGVDALRDAATWGYAAFALIVAGLVIDERMVRQAIAWYVRLVPVLLIGPVLAFALLVMFGGSLPTVPLSDVVIVNHKGGDVAVHLATVLAFVLLGLNHRFGNRSAAAERRREWWWWTLWIAGLITTLTVRAAFVTYALVLGLVMLLRPTGRWWRLAALLVTIVAVSLALDLELTVGREGRPVSAAGVMTIVQSVFSSVEHGDFDGTRRWRVLWWSDIVDYTVFGPYFWTGKGYGINLADEDGYQVWEDGSLRSPHSVHMTLLGRSGVPGLLAWLVLNLALAGSLLVAYRRRSTEGREDWARLNVWLLAFWVAVITNASFDVYVEGPAGGIWFWSAVGFMIAVLRVQPKGRPASGIASAASQNEAAGGTAKGRSGAEVQRSESRWRGGRRPAATLGLCLVIGLAGCWDQDERTEGFDPPLVITSGGTYRGNWESLDPMVPAVWIRTSEPVVIEYSTIRSRSHLIRTEVDRNVHLTVRHVHGEALPPQRLGRAPGRFLIVDTYRYVNVERSRMDGTSGIYLYRSTEGATVRVVGNQARNIDGRRSDGFDGYSETDGAQVVQFLQLNAGRSLHDSEVAWNEVINEPYVSLVEDVISLYNTTGQAGDPVRVHNNFIRGAFPADPAIDRYSGGGIMLGDGGGGFQEAYLNHVVGTSNYGIAISGGFDQRVYDNRVVSCGLLPDGTPIASQNVGVYIVNIARDSTSGAKSGSGNIVAWAHPTLVRNDTYVPDASEWSGNTSLLGQEPVSCELEDQEYALWRAKTILAGVALGPNLQTDDRP